MTSSSVGHTGNSVSRAIASPSVVFATGTRPATVHVGDDGNISAVTEGIEAGALLVPGPLSPGFIDLQVNGKLDIDVWGAASSADHDAFGRLDELMLAEGVTTWLPTLVTNHLDRYEPVISFLAEVSASAKTSIPGVHLEGPLLGDRPGAHRKNLIGAPDARWWEMVGAFTRLVTLGAEVDGATGVARELVRRGIAVSIGHSAPSAVAFAEMVSAGATMVTHLFNAMSGIHHREDSLALMALNEGRLVCGLIADGVHVSSPAIDLAFRAARGGVALVTDSVAYLSHEVGPVGISLVDGVPRLPDGTIAGSALMLPDAIRRSMAATGLDLPRVVAAATSVPARVIGLADRGEIAVGKRADLVALDSDLTPDAVWVLGRRAR